MKKPVRIVGLRISIVIVKTVELKKVEKKEKNPQNSISTIKKRLCGGGTIGKSQEVIAT